VRVCVLDLWLRSAQSVAKIGTRFASRLTTGRSSNRRFSPGSSFWDPHAVTFAFALSRHFPWRRALGYWAAQFVGAITAAAILRGSLGNIAHVGATLPSGSQGQSFLWELVMSFFLMFVIMAVATDTRAVGEAAAIAIGGTIGLDAMFGGPISGASMNPMRSLGPALISGDLHALWMYIVAPIIGTSLGAVAYQFVRGEPTPAAELQVVEPQPDGTRKRELV
jgi:Major intrinsic protein